MKYTQIKASKILGLNRTTVYSLLKGTRWEGVNNVDEEGMEYLREYKENNYTKKYSAKIINGVKHKYCHVCDKYLPAENFPLGSARGVCNPHFIEKQRMRYYLNSNWAIKRALSGWIKKNLSSEWDPVILSMGLTYKNAIHALKIYKRTKAGYIMDKEELLSVITGSVREQNEELEDYKIEDNGTVYTYLDIQRRLNNAVLAMLDENPNTKKWLYYREVVEILRDILKENIRTANMEISLAELKMRQVNHLLELLEKYNLNSIPDELLPMGVNKNNIKQLVEANINKEEESDE